MVPSLGDDITYMQAYFEWWEIFWTRSLQGFCRGDEDTRCCRVVMEDIAQSRWLVYMAMTLAFLVGAGLVSGSYLLGRSMKPAAPKYWKNRSIFRWFSDSFNEEVDVTAELKDTIQALFDSTTDPRKMGKGKDGKWATHRGLRVTKVIRIENGPLWTSYCKSRAAIRKISETLGCMEGEWKKNAEAALDVVNQGQAKILERGTVRKFVNKLNLDTSKKNEVLLFHGCPGKGALDNEGKVQFSEDAFSPLEAIKHDGMDERVGNVGCMYGSGVYFGDMASKADQYAGKYHKEEEGSVGELANMFLSRVSLGVPYQATQSLEGLRRPPCLEGHFDMSLSWNTDVKFGPAWTDKGVELLICDHSRFDSVLADYRVDGEKKLYREYIIYGKQSYPEFCVQYERTSRRD